MIPRVLAAAFFLVLTACQNMPPPFAPPEQRPPMAGFRDYRVQHVSNFSEGDMSRVVADILNPAGGWSWTGKRPTIKVPLQGRKQVHYVIDFTVADATFKTTGPVTVTFLVNDHALESVLYSKPGAQHYERAVPLEWVKADADNLVGAEVDKLWTSPSDGAKLGLILNRMGLTEQ
ncbi:MAG: hypothetical protein ABIR70_19115 [Bryobacteraceae bacterium]